MSPHFERKDEGHCESQVWFRQRIISIIHLPQVGYEKHGHSLLGWQFSTCNRWMLQVVQFDLRGERPELRRTATPQVHFFIEMPSKTSSSSFTLFCRCSCSLENNQSPTKVRQATASLSTKGLACRTRAAHETLSDCFWICSVMQCSPSHQHDIQHFLRAIGLPKKKHFSAFQVVFLLRMSHHANSCQP